MNEKESLNTTIERLITEYPAYSFFSKTRFIRKCLEQLQAIMGDQADDGQQHPTVVVTWLAIEVAVPFYFGWSGDNVMTIENYLINTNSQDQVLKPILEAVRIQELDDTLRRQLYDYGLLSQNNVNKLFKLDQQETPFLLTSLSFLAETGLLTQENFDAVDEHLFPKEVRDALEILKQADLLIQENFEVVVSDQEKPQGIAKVLEGLHQVDLLTPENREAVTKHENPRGMGDVLVQLYRAKLLTPENRVAMVKHPNPDEVAHALERLRRAVSPTSDNREVVAGTLGCQGLLTQENFEAVAKHKNPQGLGDVLVQLYRAKLLTPDNRVAMVKHPNPDEVACVLGRLRCAVSPPPENREVVTGTLGCQGLLTQENFEAVAKHKNPRGLSDVLVQLHRATLLTPDNRRAVIQQQNPSLVSSALEYLRNADLLTQENFDALIKNPVLITWRQNALSLWQELSLLRRGPDDQLKQIEFDKLVRIAQGENAKGGLKREISALKLNRYNKSKHSQAATSSESASPASLR